MGCCCGLPPSGTDPAGELVRTISLLPSAATCRFHTASSHRAATADTPSPLLLPWPSVEGRRARRAVLDPRDRRAVERKRGRRDVAAVELPHAVAIRRLDVVWAEACGLPDRDS